MTQERTITMKGSQLSLTGTELKTGDQAPEFTVLDGDMKEVGLKDFSDKIKIISVTPSLDTPVCDMQARRFNQDAAHLPDDVVILNISMDLPFAISRFCTTAGIDKVKAFSDHREASFGMAYGVLIKETRLLARSIFVVDKNGKIQYVEIVPELTEQPDYDKALEAVKKLSA